MKSNTDHITIGRDLRLTLDILDGIRRREQRKLARQQKWLPLTRLIRRLSRRS